MKHLKKLASLLLATIMVFGLTATALATAGAPTDPTPTYNDNMQDAISGGSIRITNAVKDHKYNLYQIMYLEEYSTGMTPAPTDTARAYKANSLWETFLKEVATSYVKVDKNNYVTWLKYDTDGKPVGAAEFAELAIAYAKDASNNIHPILDKAITATDATVDFPNLNLGYYLVDSTVGTICGLTPTNPEETLWEKNAVPSNEKEVQENSTGEYGKVNDAQIGETVNFRSTVELPAGSENVVYHDTMSSGLTLIDWFYNAEADPAASEWGIKVYSDAAMETELNLGTDYTIKFNHSFENHTNEGDHQRPALTTGDGDNEVTLVSYYGDSDGDGCTFEVSFTQAYLDGLTETSTVYVKYSAKINENAVIGGDGNTNTSHLDYGDEGNTQHTPESTTKTYTWSFDVLKYANGDQTVTLSGAKFVLLNKDKDQVATIVNGKLTGWAKVPEGIPSVPEITADEVWPENTVLTTAEDGKINIDGLDAGTYYLREIKAPNGYNMLAALVTVTITPDELKPIDGEEQPIGYTGDELTLAPVTIPVNNNSGTELPDTGGIGTTIFYVVGSILLVGAVVLLVVKKRMSVSK